MANKSKDIGTRGETKFTAHAVNNGFPQAIRRALEGDDVGDVHLDDMIVVQVKSGHMAEQAGRQTVEKWLMDAKTQARACSKPYYALVTKRKGYSEHRVGQWDAFAHFNVLRAYQDRGHPMAGYGRMVVQMSVDDLLAFFRYGE